jgi:CRP-like cAMP-binding protein
MSVESIDNKADMLGKTPLFDSVSDKEFYLIASYMQVLQVPEGEVVFAEGEMGDHIYFIVSGELNIYKKTEQDKQLLISKIGKGRVLGEMNIIDRFPRSATVIAQTRTTLLTLSHEHFEQILEDHPRDGISFFRGIVRTLSLNLRDASGKHR